MSYARSKNSVHKVENLLKQLSDADGDLVFQSTEPQKLAYAIHEALKSAKLFPEFESYAKLSNKYVIRIRQNKVIAELRSRPLDGIQIIRDELSRMTLKDIVDITGVVGAALTHKSVSELYFPDLKVDHSSLTELYQWSEPAGYYIINHDENGITLTKSHPGEMNWTPSHKANGRINVENI